VTFIELLSKYLLIMRLRFDVMLYSNFGNENSGAGHVKCSRGPHLARRPQVPHPCSKLLKYMERYPRTSHGSLKRALLLSLSGISH